MQNIIFNNKLFKYVLYFIFFISLTIAIMFGCHLLLNLGRYFGTIARYVAEWNISIF